MNFTQVFHLTTADGSKRSFSIDQICVNYYEVSLCNSIYSGKAPVFETPQSEELLSRIGGRKDGRWQVNNGEKE